MAAPRGSWKARADTTQRTSLGSCVGDGMATALAIPSSPPGRQGLDSSVNPCFSVASQLITVGAQDSQQPAAENKAELSQSVTGDPRKWRVSKESSLRRVVGSHSFHISEDTWALWYRNAVADLLGMNAFKNFIGIVILLNAVTIGVESSARVQDWLPALDVLFVVEQLFLSIYVVELGLRFFAFGWRCIFDNWVKFDSVLVGAGVLTNWILPVFDTGLSGLGFLLTLRLLRLLRLARTVRLIASVRDLWLLVKSCLDSTGTMMYTIGLLGMVLYVFACIGLELITLSPANIGPDADPTFQNLVDQYFSSLGATMISLVQFVSFDSISNIYRPFIESDPSPPFLTIYFVFAFVMIGIVLMNLITAVVVNSALDQASQDKDVMRMHEEVEKKKMISALKKIFWRLDTDGSGTISLDEIQAMTLSDRATMLTKVGDFDPLDLFAALDVDGTCVLEIETFCDSIWQVSHSQVPLEVKRTETQVVAIRRQLQEVVRRLAELQGSVALVLDSWHERQAKPSLAGSPESSVPLASPATGFPSDLSVRGEHHLTQTGQHGEAAPGSAGRANALESRGFESFPRDTPAWGQLLLRELQQLRLECLQPPLSIPNPPVGMRPGQMHADAVQTSSLNHEAPDSASCLGNWHRATAEQNQLQPPPDACPRLFGVRTPAMSAEMPREDTLQLAAKVAPTAGSSP